MATRELYLNRQTNTLHESFTSNGNAELQPFYQGDTGTIFNVHNLTANNAAVTDPNRPFKYLDPTGESLEIALGNINEKSTGGTGSLIDPTTEATSGTLVSGARYYISTYVAGDNFTNVGGTNVTANIFTASGATPTTWSNGSTLVQICDAIDYNSTAGALQTAIRAKLATNYSNATVSIGSDGEPNPWTIDRVTLGDIDPLESLATSLTPDSIVKVEELRQGTTYLSARQRVRFIQRPAVYAISTTYFSAATATVSNARTGTANVNAIHRVVLSSGVYGGYWTLQSTTLGVGNGTTRQSSPIPFGATKDQMEDLINDRYGSGNEVTVTIIDDYTFDIEFTGTNVDLVAMTLSTTVATYLLSAMGWVVEFSTNTSGVSDLLGDEDEIQTQFEIQHTDISGDTTTLLQIQAQLIAELISPGTSGSSEFPGFTTAAQYALATQYSAVTVSSAGDTELTIVKYCKVYTYDVTVSSGAYTRNIDLGSVSADRVAGDLVQVILTVAATATMVIVIRNNTGSTTLYTDTSTGAAYVRNLWFVWTGSAWKSCQGAS